METPITPEQLTDTLSAIPGASVRGNSVTISCKPPKLRANRNGKGYTTSYTLSVGCAEARRVGFLNEDGSSKELEKIIDEAAQTITIRIAQPKEPTE